MLKANPRVFEQLTLATDVILIALCWLAAYGLRFYVVGPPLVTPDVPPFRQYLLQRRAGVFRQNGAETGRLREIEQGVGGRRGVFHVELL